MLVAIFERAGGIFACFFLYRCDTIESNLVDRSFIFSTKPERLALRVSFFNIYIE